MSAVRIVHFHSGTQDTLSRPAPTTVPRTLYSDLPGETSSKPLRGKRLGVHFAWGNAAEAEVAQAFRKVLRMVAELGCQVPFDR